MNAVAYHQRMGKQQLFPNTMLGRIAAYPGHHSAVMDIRIAAGKHQFFVDMVIQTCP